MPMNIRAAAVEHQAWRGNGAMFVSGNNVEEKNGVCVVFLNAGEAGERLPLGKSVQFCAYLLFVGALAARLSDG